MCVYTSTEGSISKNHWRMSGVFFFYKQQKKLPFSLCCKNKINLLLPLRPRFVQYCSCPSHFTFSPLGLFFYIYMGIYCVFKCTLLMFKVIKLQAQQYIRSLPLSVTDQFCFLPPMFSTCLKKQPATAKVERHHADVAHAVEIILPKPVRHDPNHCVHGHTIRNNDQK